MTGFDKPPPIPKHHLAYAQAHPGPRTSLRYLVVIDRKVAFITSANFTGAAQSRNIEAGVLLRQPRIATRLHGYFEGLIGTGVLRRII